MISQRGIVSDVRPNSVNRSLSRLQGSFCGLDSFLKIVGSFLDRGPQGPTCLSIFCRTFWASLTAAWTFKTKGSILASRSRTRVFASSAAADTDRRDFVISGELTNLLIPATAELMSLTICSRGSFSILLVSSCNGVGIVGISGYSGSALTNLAGLSG